MPEEIKEGSLRDLFIKRMDKRKTSQNTSSMQYVPDTEYQHKATIMTNQEARKIEDIPAFLSKELSIANIKDPFELFIASERVNMVLMPLWQLMIRLQGEERDAMADLFYSQMVPFLASLKLTRSLDGMERRLQGNQPLQSQSKREWGMPKFGENKDTPPGGEIKYD